MLFSSLIELYFEDCRNRLKPTTLDNKEYIINLNIPPYFKDMPLNTIDATLISYQDEEGTPYSQTYLKTINNQLSAIMNYAQKYYKLSKNLLLSAAASEKVMLNQ